MNTTVASNPRPPVKNRSVSTRHMVLAGMFAALLAVISQISIPLPTGVPITIQVFGIALVGTVLGWKLGLMSVLAYILLGAVGLPIFANFQGGVQCLAGMSGGYIIAWPAMTVLSGIRVKGRNRALTLACSAALSILGLMIVEIAGGFQWSLLSGDMTFGAVMAYSFVAFIPKDIIITVLAVVIGNQVRGPLEKAGFLRKSGF